MAHGVNMRVLLILPFFIVGSLARAEVVTSSESGFELRHEATSLLEPYELWDILIEPKVWWDGNHTYSGDAANLSLGGKKAGSYWREDWDGGSVIHGQVLTAMEDSKLVLSAPFGPLQGTGATCIWTITLSPAEGGGTLIRSRHVIAGAPGTGLEELAGPVDRVMSNGIERLAVTP